MAGADYHRCDNPQCSNKAFYDADIYVLEPEESTTLGEFKALCKECSEKYEIVFKLKSPARKHKEFELPAWAEKLPDNALLSSKEIMNIFGYSKTTSPRTMIDKGRLPKPDNLEKPHKNGAMVLRWSVGYLKSIKKGA